MKIMMAQISTQPGFIEENTNKIIEQIKIAKKENVDLIVFPELTIPGYLSMDLILEKNYVKKNKEALKQITLETENITAIVGFVDEDENKEGADNTKIKYNSAAIIQNKKVIGIQDKTLLPEYDIFSEKRYFSDSRGSKIFNIHGKKVGIEICEDMWDKNYKNKVSKKLQSKGAELIINLSASPFHIGKLNERISTIKKITKENNIDFIYTNLVGSFDGYDGQIIFDGQSIAINKNGEIVKIAKKFEEDKVIIKFNEKLSEEKINTNDLEDTYKSLVLGIKEYFNQSHMKKAFIGLSGGIDSALVAALAVKALGKENVKGILMPSMYSSEGSITDAKKLSENLGIEYSIIPITQIYHSVERTMEKEFKKLPLDVTEENIQARTRGLILMAEANKFKGLVLSTGNKTEMALGYCTLYGDMNGGLAVISDLNKLRVYALSKYINEVENREVIPENTISKAPSAELSFNQTDEKGLGASYSILSPLVDKIIEERESIEELKKEFGDELVKDIYRKIKINEFKRRQSPPGIRVTSKSFGIGRRVPINHGWS